MKTGTVLLFVFLASAVAQEFPATYGVILDDGTRYIGKIQSIDPNIHQIMLQPASGENIVLDIRRIRFQQKLENETQIEAFRKLSWQPEKFRRSARWQEMTVVVNRPPLKADRLFAEFLPESLQTG